MRNIALVLALCTLIFAVGCAGVYSPVAGAIYTDVKGPIGATDHAKGTKNGDATASSILGLIALGDASIETAMNNGGISKVSTVDHHSWSILGIYSKFTTKVTGE